MQRGQKLFFSAALRSDAFYEVYSEQIKSHGVIKLLACSEKIVKIACTAIREEAQTPPFYSMRAWNVVIGEFYAQSMQFNSYEQDILVIQLAAILASDILMGTYEEPQNRRSMHKNFFHFFNGRHRLKDELAIKRPLERYLDSYVEKNVLDNVVKDLSQKKIAARPLVYLLYQHIVSMELPPQAFYPLLLAECIQALYLLSNKSYIKTRRSHQSILKEFWNLTDTANRL